MHELSIAAAIAEMAGEEAARRGVRVHAVHLKLGPLSGVVKEALLFAYDVAVQGTALEGSHLVVEDAPVVAFCRECGMNQPIASMQSLCCPQCRAPTPDIVEGTELLVTALEVDP